MKKKHIFWVLQQIRCRIPSIFILTGAHMGQAFCAVLFALGSRGVIDSAVAGDPQLFMQACGKQAAIIAGILLCLTLARHLRDQLAADLDRDWKQRLLHGLLHGDYAAVSQYHSAELLNRLNNDVRKVNDGLLTILPSVASLLTRLVAAVIVLGTLDARFMLLMGLLGLIVVVTTGFARRHLKELNKRVNEHDGKVSGFLQETMEKLLVVQAMDIAPEVERRSNLLLADRYAIQRKRKNLSLLANSCVSILSYGAGFLALIWCAHRMLKGQMSFGSLTAVIQLVNQLKMPFVNLSGILPRYAEFSASAERLMELDAIQGEPAPAEASPEELYESMDSICASGLTFSYDRDPVFQNAEFVLPKGTFAAITGQSGIGKSTLLKLLLGVFAPESGALYLNCNNGKIPINRSTRRLFAYVPQGNLLFSGTLRDNLLIVKPDATEEEIRQAVYVSCMDAFLPGLPMGLDTLLGESGSGLSEGQAQRLAIARAILGGAPILLLDECTSALDEKMERAVLSRLRQLPDRTCIAVTHRQTAITLCDRRLEVRGGTICVYPN